MKSIYYTLSLAGKEIRLILADRGTLALLILLPILLGSLFAGLNLMANSDEGENPDILLEVSLVNEDPGAFSAKRWPNLCVAFESSTQHLIWMSPLLKSV